MWLLAAFLPLSAEAAPASDPTLGGRHGHVSTKRSRVAARSRPIPVYTRSGQPNIQAHAALIVDTSAGGLPLYQKNPDEVRPIASISKLMAMLVVLGATSTCAHTTITEGDARLTVRRQVTAASRHDADQPELLHAALMASDNRAVLAWVVPPGWNRRCSPPR